MRKIKALLFGGLLMPMVSSCAALSPHENFKGHMRGNVGKKIDGPSTLWVKPDRYVGTRQLSNGNTEKEYKLRGTCRYFFEFNPETRVIVGWRFEGSEKDCAIVP